MRNNVYKLCGLVMCTVMLGLGEPEVLFAQKQPQPVYETGLGNISNIGWSSDGKQLVFQDIGDISNDQTGEIGWLSVGPEADKTTKIYSRPLQPTLIANQIQSLQVANVNGIMSPIFTSPDNHYAVYAANKDPLSNDNDWPIAIADLQSGKFVTTNIFTDAYSDTDYSFYVKWSPTSNSVAIKTVTSYAAENVYFIANSGSAITQPTVQNLTSDGLPLGSETLPIYDVFDISNDGKTLLLGSQQNLLLANIDAPAMNRILVKGQFVLDAKFMGHNPSNILIATQNNLSAYDISNSQPKTQLIVDFGNLGGISKGVISPDGASIAIVHNNPQANKSQLYLVKIGK